jgi:hypothetical protein
MMGIHKQKYGIIIFFSLARKNSLADDFKLNVRPAKKKNSGM